MKTAFLCFPCVSRRSLRNRSRWEIVRPIAYLLKTIYFLFLLATEPVTVDAACCFCGLWPSIWLFYSQRSQVIRKVTRGKKLARKTAHSPCCRRNRSHGNIFFSPSVFALKNCQKNVKYKNLVFGEELHQTLKVRRRVGGVGWNWQPELEADVVCLFSVFVPWRYYVGVVVTEVTLL
jgi:hypothetical protein